MRSASGTGTKPGPAASAGAVVALAAPQGQPYTSLDTAMLGTGDGTTAYASRLDSMEKALQQLLASVETLSASISASGGVGSGGTNEFTLGYKQGFADGYSHGFHEAKLSLKDQPPTPATSDIAQQTLDQIQKAPNFHIHLELAHVVALGRLGGQRLLPHLGEMLWVEKDGEPIAADHVGGEEDWDDPRVCTTNIFRR